MDLGGKGTSELETRNSKLKTSYCVPASSIFTIHNRPKKTIMAGTSRGLEGVIALDSKISAIDGEEGVLIYRGYNIFDFAEKADFEEIAFLLWNGRLPNQSELDELQKEMKRQRELPKAVISLLKDTPKDANGMAVLRTAVSALSFFDDHTEDNSRESNYNNAIRLTARIPTILAAFARIRRGLEPVAPLREKSTAFNFLYMLNNEEPGEKAEATMDTALILHADHGLNASTFTGRVIGSTLSDMYSAVTGAIGALKGPLHGGANIKVMETLKHLRANNLDPVEYVKDSLANKVKIMGFGHRVYKTMDPRATILKGMLVKLSEEKGDSYWLETSEKMMETMVGEKNIYPNVDFFSASVYHLLGIDSDLFTPIFAMSRVSGWTAHLLEQWEANRLIRPRAAYVGEKNLTYVPIAER